MLSNCWLVRVIEIVVPKLKLTAIFIIFREHCYDIEGSLLKELPFLLIVHTSECRKGITFEHRWAG